ncbi:MAG: phosphoglycerate dehydrogenase, partial [Nitrospirae bacterium]
VDVDAASKRGIVVMNTPGGNAVTTAEHAIALLLAAARRIPEADASLRAGRWERKRFVGVELEGKTLGVIGLGNVGSVVARKARGLGMRVVAYDPYLTPERASELGVTSVTLDELLASADAVTVHVPLSERTRGLLGRDEIARMRPGAILVNCARGGIVDEAALAEAVASGHLRAAALDVFETEPPPADHPLLAAERTVVTPHLGASTAEAQEKVAVAIAHQVLDFLTNGEIRNAVNAPAVGREALQVLGPYLRLASRLGRLVVQLHDGTARRIAVTLAGDLAHRDPAPLVARAVAGVLAPVVEGPVNEVNALALAAERGISVETTAGGDAAGFAALLRVRLEGTERATQAAGTVFGTDDPRIVMLDGFLLEAMGVDRPLVLITNRDVPGVIGKVGTTLGAAGINIAQMYVGRPEGGGDPVALTVVALDAPAPEEVLAQLEAHPEVLTVRQALL